MKTINKTCIYCGVSKRLFEFYNNKANKDGKTGACKCCIKEKSRKYREANADYYQAYMRNYYQINKSSIRAANKKWAEEHPDIINKSKRKYEKNKIENDPQYKISKRVSTYMRTSLKEGKGTHWELIVGYSIDDLIKHIENQFQFGMSWENYGDWHIDNIIPISLFEFNSIKDLDFKMCWSLKNLQPLWAFDNLSKGNRILETKVV